MGNIIIMKEIRFAQNLKQLRVARGMTQAQLAKLLGVDQRTVSAWEKSVCEPSLTLLSKIAEIMDETIDGLLF